MQRSLRSSAAHAAGLLAFLAVAVVSGQSPPPVPQGPTPTFKAQVEYVEVDALVFETYRAVLKPFAHPAPSDAPAQGKLV